MKKKVRKFIFGSVGLTSIPFLAILFLLFAGSTGSPSSTSADVVNGVTYVEHWTSGDAYTHHFLHQRYGITEEQINGFIKSQGYDPVGRASGKSFLEAQSKSGIDVRVLVAFAQAESSYGTAGVAKQFPQANIWGYGCVDSDPNQGRDWGPDRAFNNFRTYQIETLGNYNLKICDERARQYASGTLPAGKGVYYSDTSGTGKVRASIMEAFDKYIDEHGGTPKAPKGSSPGRRGATGNGTVASSWEFPSEYSGKLKYGQPSQASLTTQSGNGYPQGQCTWFVYNRLYETGIINAGDDCGYLGNANMWEGSLSARGWKKSSTPVVGAVVVSYEGAYGHVMFIEHVNSDGTFLISECNYAGNQSQVHFRVCTQQTNFAYMVKK